jgi:predicted nucleic acid-binding protein
MPELPESVGADANCFVYALEIPDSPRGRYIAQQLLNGRRIIASTLALSEFLVSPYRTGTRAEVAVVRANFENLPGLELYPVSAEIADHAARIRAATNLRLPDAIHIATALVTRAGAFLTNDRQLLRAQDELPILILDDVVGLSGTP